MHRRWRWTVLLPVLLVTSGCGYNRIQQLQERVDAERGQIQVMLQRRADLVPNLVETVRGFARQEADVLNSVTRARAGLQDALDRPGGASAEELATADAQLARAINVVVEAYPELRSNENFLRLQDELTGTENRLATARTDYNRAVQEYNAYIRAFPQVITARLTGATAREYYQTTDPAAREVPRVQF